MSESKKSGEFILNNLQIFNETYNFFMTSINNKIEHGIDKCVEEFSKENDWESEFKFSEEWDKNWLRPKIWDENYGNKTKFTLDNTESEEEDNLWLSLFCRKSNSNAEVGFFFDVETKFFGKKNFWNAHIREIPEEQKKFLKKIGFKQFNGRFFLPIELSNETLAKSWMEKDDPFAFDDECFEPLYDALEKLKQSVPIFEAIMESALASQDS